MSFDSFLDTLGLNANVTLCDSGTAVLEEPLNESNVITVVPVNLRSIPLPEGMRADSLIAEIIADKSELFLDSSCCDREQNFVAADPVAQAIVFDILMRDVSG